MKDFKPTLAANADLTKLVFPVYASPKLDGIRCTVIGGKAISRTKKPIANDYIRSLLSNRKFEGFDGELIVGEPTAPDCFNRSTSGVMRHDGQPDFTFWVFDTVDGRAAFYKHRLKSLREMEWNPAERVRLLPQTILTDLDQLSIYEAERVDAGYEGVILRSPEAPYKFGRSTANEGYLLKVKRFEDSECQIVSIEEEMHNANEAQTNELGRTKRSTAKAGLVGKGTMGALVVRDIHHGWQFNIGSGFTAAQRAAPWKIGSIHKYKFFPVGMKDVPRHPVYIGPRSKLDL